MKKSDIITTTFIAILGFVASFFVVQALVGDPDKTTITFKTIDVVSNEVADPSPDTFNSQALNPTVEVFVGDPSKKSDEATTDNNKSTENTSQNSQTGD